MANPRSKGIGSGAAQIYDYSRIDNAMNNALRMVGAKDERAAAKREKDDAKKDAAIKELRGAYGDYDTSNIREADKDPLINMINQGYKEIDGHWEDVVNGDPYWTNLYNNQVMAQKKFIGNSSDAKKTMTDIYNKAKEPESGYSEDRLKAYEELSLKPGVTVNQLKEEGLLRRDQIIGNVFSKVDDALGTDGALYEEVDTSYSSPTGFVERKGREWLPDDEAKIKFKETVSGDPDLLTDMSIKYKDLSLDEQYDAFYNDYKTSRIDEYMAKSSGKKDPRTSGDGSSSIGINVVPYKLSNGTQGITFANAKKGLTPIAITVPKKGNAPERVLNVVPSEIYKDKNGKWRLRGKAVGKSWNELTSEEQEKYGSENKYLQTAESGDAVDQVIHDNMSAKIKAQYGISNYNDYITEDAKPSAEDLIKKYAKK